MARNGELDTRTLVRVDGWALLAPATAASWVAACNEMVALGYPRPTITAPDGAYRDLAGQRYWKAYWTARGKPGNAATPGHSNHGWGTAVDLYNVYRYYRPDLVRVFAKHGFTFNVPSELWHVQHNGTWPASGGGGATPIPAEEDDMYTDDDRKNVAELRTAIANVHAGIWSGGATTIDGVVQKFKYGVLPIVAHNQTLIAALTATVKALATGQGADPAAIEKAAYDGAARALRDVTFKADI